MSQDDLARAAAGRVDELLGELHGSPDPRAAVVADELTGCLVRLYGEGLARIAALLGPERVAALCADPLVESLLLVHDLHPRDTGTRVRLAAERFSAYAEVVLAEVDAAGVARLRLTTGSACGGSREALQTEIAEAVRSAAPELSGVEIRLSAAPPLFQVTLRPGIA
ncbi:NifU family protein [Actinoplanes aureus]|uniref:NifU family protein n=1 Tax=Actinoplanes aureus TaxID=2792083 RepID=A0A931CD30_9ACTN|nr:NifU family protein [Actinoplanes aureus]MBG0565116.1 NifU family protein [Actinoplanes aureus]